MSESVSNATTWTGASPPPDVEPLLAASAWALVETMRCQNGHLLLGRLHLERLERGRRLLGWPRFPDYWPQQVLQAIAEALDQSKLTPKKAKVRLQAMPLSLESETPGQVGFWIQAAPMPQPSSEGLVIGLYPEHAPSPTAFGRIKLAGQTHYLAARAYAQQQNWSDCVLLTQQRELVETGIGNLVYRRRGFWYTPPLSSGCLQGVLRAWLLEHRFVEERRLLPADLNKTDVLLRINALRGPEPIREFLYSSPGGQKTFSFDPKTAQTWRRKVESELQQESPVHLQLPSL